ncbi:MAG: xanthine dehydrogenase family protein subunit M [Desulfurellaceae bacterium]|nr:xanthine dehydrogenase family protein subunit M [Desulfurellaceae bacterium]
MSPFEYIEPQTLEEALDALARYGDEAKLIAGGTGLVNLMKQRLVQPAYLIGLRRLAQTEGLAEIDQIGPPGSAQALRLGALCTHRALEASPLVQTAVPVLAETFGRVASIRIRSVATLGGALAHADPNQDPPPSLIVLDARVCLRSNHGQREVGIAEFFVDYYETVLEPAEMLTAVIVPPLPANSGTSFLKFLPQTQDDYATVAVAARLTLDADRIVQVRVALGAAGATPLRASVVEAALQGQQPTPAIIRDAAALVAEAVDPSDDFRGSADYKRDMAVVFVERALDHALGRARAGGGQG